MFSSNAEKYAVLGHPIGHSLSPSLHNTIFGITGFDGVYTAFDILPEKLGEAVVFFKEYFCGFNCTIPFKQQIIPYLDNIDKRARLLGSVNTVKISDGKLLGYSTDGVGMRGALEIEGISLNDKKVLIIGAGGVARVAVFEALMMKCSVTIAARDTAKAELLAKEASLSVGGSIDVCEIRNIKGSFDILIQCTPVGMYPEISFSPVDIEVIKNCEIIFDTVYNPKETKIIKDAVAMGKKTVGGINMLILQGVASQEIWRNIKITKEQIKRIKL